MNTIKTTNHKKIYTKAFKKLVLTTRAAKSTKMKRNPYVVSKRKK